MTETPLSSTSQRTGQVIRGMYRLGKMIGRGGMGEVYEADHVSIPKRYAIKILRGDAAENPEALKRFHREAIIAASVGSAHIVQVYDFNQAEDGCLYMAMELLEGEVLTDYLARESPVDPWQWLAIMTQIANGLDAAHAAGVVHRDMKPDNIFISNINGNEIIKILDFGISKIKTTETMQTQAGAIMGTPNYMSPEQAEGEARDVDARADIFSMGAIAYEALCGDLAFGGPSLPAVFMKICFEDPIPLGQVAPHLPYGAIAAVDKAVSKRVEDRFGSLGEFCEAFRAGLQSDEVAPVTGVAGPATVRSDGGPQTSSDASTSTLSGAAAQAQDVFELPRKRNLALPVAGGIGALVVAVGLLLFFTRGGTDTKTSAAGAAKPAVDAPAEALDAGAAEQVRVQPLPMAKAKVSPDAGLAHARPVRPSMRKSTRRRRRRARPRVVAPSMARPPILIKVKPRRIAPRRVRRPRPPPPVPRRRRKIRDIAD